jgi:hypothetical protein
VAYRALVDQIINTAAADGAYVMLDMHWSDMGVWGANNGQHFLPDDHTTLFWQDAAGRYANNPTVLFDPYNEPHFANDEPSDADFALWQNGGTVTETGEFNGTYHSPGMQGLIDTIRATGANNVVAPEGLNWGSNLSGVFNGHALSDPAGNLMYQAHLYPNKLADASVADSVEQVAQAYPIYVGEWGSGGVVGQPDAGAAQSNQTMLAYLDAHHFSWTAWAMTPDLEGEYNLVSAWDGNAATSDYGVNVQANLAAHANDVPTPAPVAAPPANPGNGPTPPANPGQTGNPPDAGSGQAARELVATELTHSAEYYSNFVTAAYERYLGRAPDAVGLAYWVRLMQGGLTDERLEAGFIGSYEYIQDHGGPGAGWVTGLYKDLLGREERPDEIAYWINNLNNGMSPADVAFGFAASVERESQRVAADYGQYLGRGAAPWEVSYWVNVFLGTADNEKVIAGFVSSQESFQKMGGDIHTWLSAAYQEILHRAPDAAGEQYYVSLLQ